MARILTLHYEKQRLLALRVWAWHSLIVLGAVLAAVAITLPSLFRQPTLYTSQAIIRYDQATFGDLVAKNKPSDALYAQQQQLGEVLYTVGGNAELGYEDLGLRGLEYTYPAPGTIVVRAYARNPDTALSIADEAVAGLAVRMYAISGTAQLREVLSRVDHAALTNQGAQNEETRLLRGLLLTQAVADVSPRPGDPSLGALSPAQRGALTRALEVRYDETRVDIRKAEQKLRDTPAANTTQRAAALEQRRGAQATQNAVEAVLAHLYDVYDAQFDGRGTAPAFVAQSAAPATLVPSYNTLKLMIAALVGLVGGGLTVLIDRQVGILAKLQELWAYRELMRNMIARDLKARYKNSVLGYVWSLLNPLLMMLVFWIVFSLLIPNNIRMFPVFLIVALLPWTFTVTAVSNGMRAILDNANLVKKVYFPREILPITVVLSNLVNYVLALPVMFLVMAGVQLVDIERLNFSWTFAFLPVIVIIQVVFLIGVALLLSSTAVFFRDTTLIIDVFLQLWIFLTPVFFALEQIATPLQARALRWINPMASIIDFYRDILYGQVDPGTIPTPGLPALDGVFRTLLTALVVLALGAFVFHRSSARFGEEI